MTGLTRLTIGILFLSLGTSWGMDIKAKSALIMDADSGKVLWARDEKAARFPASTTKIMTALLLLEHCLPDEVITAPDGIEKIEESSLHLKKGEKIDVENMLYALMLRSANDGCVAVAKHISGSVEAFAKLMNERAKQIGCVNTHFNNPNGLNDPKHTTCAYDLALIAREAMKYDLFRRVVRTPKKELKRSINQKDLLVENHNKWLLKDLSADGIKTGYTRDAGKCYVGSATRDGYRIITVILKTEDWQSDHQQMLNWAFKNHERRLFAKKGDEVLKVPIADGESAEASVKVDSDIYHIYRLDQKPSVIANLKVNPNLVAPIKAGQPIGLVTFTDGTGWQVDAPAYLGESVPVRQSLLGTTVGKAGFGILGGVLAFGAFAWRTRAKRSKAYAETARSSFF